MLAHAVTHALVGLDARKVEVEAHLQNGLPGLAIVGLADRACQEAKHRVRSGIDSAELEWPSRRITVNLAPAALRKEGSGSTFRSHWRSWRPRTSFRSTRFVDAAIGELALDGRVRPVRGVLAAAEGARSAGAGRLVCAAESAAEAALASVEPIPARHLAEVVSYLRGETEPPPVEHTTNGATPARDDLDLEDVRGQERARRALELAAAVGTTSCSRARRNRKVDARAPAAGNPAGPDCRRVPGGDADLPVAGLLSPTGR